MIPRRIKNESGIILVTVLAICLVMITLVIGLLSTNANFVNIGQGQMDRIKADQLAKSNFWRNYMSLTTSGVGYTPSPTTAISENIDDGNGGHSATKAFSQNISSGPTTDPGLNNTMQYIITISY